MAKFNPKDLLNAARRLRARLSSPETWIKGAMAKDHRDNRVPAASDLACKWCLVGAQESLMLESEVHFQLTETMYRELTAMGANVGVGRTGWNDARDRKHSEIVAFLDRVVKRVQKEHNI